ncbi:MAG: GntR family transcriptional regulator [Bacilli bacterium]|nr:GntR family transcriptional regulator [Bacilli bacterium]
MHIIISNSSSIPIYEQIKTNIITRIMNDELTSEELLPSIRVLASDLKISIMTVKKAYDELEKEGYIKIIQGKGAYIAAKNTAIAREQASKIIEEHINKIIEISKKYNISKEEIINTYEYLNGSEE